MFMDLLCLNIINVTIGMYDFRFNLEHSTYQYLYIGKCHLEIRSLCILIKHTSFIHSTVCHL